MNEQETINKFVHDLKMIFDLISLSDSGIKLISVNEVGGHVELKILSNSLDELLVTSDNCEITICFCQTHWHINTYSDPLDIDTMKITCLTNILDIINSNILTYSAWKNGKCLGGSSVKNDIDVIENAKEIFTKADMIKVQSFNSAIKEIKISAQQGDAPEPVS
jgi:hypothetical protein